jgi:hypothetical protein
VQEGADSAPACSVVSRLVGKVGALIANRPLLPKASSDQPGVSVYGLGRFSVTLYYEQWVRLLDASDNLRKFLEDNKSRLKLKPKE